MVFCPFLRKKGFCLKGSNCDFSHSDLNQNTATNQPLSNENQLSNDQLPFLEKNSKKYVAYIEPHRKDLTENGSLSDNSSTLPHSLLSITTPPPCSAPTPLSTPSNFSTPTVNGDPCHPPLRQ